MRAAICLLVLLAGCSDRATAAADRQVPLWPDLLLDHGHAHDQRLAPDLRADARRADQGRPDAATDARGEAAPPAGWQKVVALSAEDLHDVACVAGHVVAVGDKGTILHAAPASTVFNQELACLGGSPCTPSTSDLHTVAFADATYGVAGGKDSTIWQTNLTTSSGTWSVAPQCSAFVFETFYGLHLHTATAGYGAGVAVSGEAGFKYFSGYSWVCGPSTFAGKVFYDVFRLGSSGWIVGDTGGLIYKLEDGSASTPPSYTPTWTTVPAGTAQVLRAITFSGASSGLAVGAAGAIVRSTDGKGEVWGAVTSPASVELWDVAFADASHAFAVGAGGTILTSADGGQSWSAQASPTTARLEGVCFASASEGWAVGAGGVILHTTSGGL